MRKLGQENLYGRVKFLVMFVLKGFRPLRYKIVTGPLFIYIVTHRFERQAMYVYCARVTIVAVDK